jgi:lipopolysaccharide/colanic/teichoic acid biosynthesis glycosyltransferase
MLAVRTAIAPSPARTGLDQGVTGERPTWLRTLWSSDLVRRVVAVHRLKLCVLVGASGLGLLALAVLILLTNTVALVISLAIVGTIIFLLVRWGRAEARSTNAGG